MSHVVNIFYYLLKCLKMYQDMYIASTRCLPRIAFAKCSVKGVMHFFTGNKVFVCFLLFVVGPFSDIRLEARVKPI